MNESTIIQKLINVGVYLDAGNIDYNRAVADVEYLLKKYLKLKFNTP